MELHCDFLKDDDPNGTECNANVGLWPTTLQGLFLFENSRT